MDRDGRIENKEETLNWYPAEITVGEQSNAQPLDPYIDMAKNFDAPKILINALVDELQQLDKKHRKRAAVQVALKVVVLNGFLARHDWGDSRRVHYSRASDAYTGMRVNRSTLMNVVSSLKGLGYLHSYVVTPGSHNLFRSSFRIRSKLWQMCVRYRLHPRMITSESVIELRAPKKKKKNTKGAMVTQRGKLISTRGRKVVGLAYKLKKLKQINHMYRGFIGLLLPDESLCTQASYIERAAYEQVIDQGLPNEEIHRGSSPNFRRTTLKRIFNNVDKSAPKLDQGGRFCGAWWQEIPGDIRRSHIWLGGERAIELDYRSMEVSLAYAKKGLVLEDVHEHDPYLYLGGADRKIGKRLLLIAFNCDNRQSATGAINKYLGK